MELNVNGLITALRVEGQRCIKGQNLITANMMFSLAQALDNCINGVLAENYHNAATWTAQPDPKPGYVTDNDGVPSENWFPDIGWSQKDTNKMTAGIPEAETITETVSNYTALRRDFDRLRRYHEDVKAVSVQRMERIHELENELKRVTQQRDMLYGIVTQAAELLKNGGG